MKNGHAAILASIVFVLSADGARAYCTNDATSSNCDLTASVYLVRTSCGTLANCLRL